MVQDIKLQKAEDGKGLSTNDYTNADKNKLNGIAAGATKVIVNNTLSSSSTTEALSAAQGKVLSDDNLELWTELLAHGHAIADVTGLQSALAAKQSKIVVTTEAPTSATGYADGTIVMVIE